MVTSNRGSRITLFIPSDPNRFLGDDSVAAENPGLTAGASDLVCGNCHACLNIIRIGIPVGTQESVPKIVDEGKIAVAICMMNKMELLLSPEPGKS